MGCASPDPLAWHHLGTLEASLGSILLLCWGSGIVCLPWHAVGRECQQAMGRAPWQALPSAECLALRTPFFASAVLLLLAAACACPWGHGSIVVGLAAGCPGQGCPVSQWMAPYTQQGVVPHFWEPVAGCMGMDPPRG